jgi:hypothetical protein
MPDRRSASAFAVGRNPTAAALTATLGLAAAAWVVAVRQMSGMDMGPATELGSYLAIWALAALGVMSVTWPATIAVAGLAQKLLPAKAAVDVPLAVAIAGLGILIIIAPSSIPGLTPPM